MNKIILFIITLSVTSSQVTYSRSVETNLVIPHLLHVSSHVYTGIATITFSARGDITAYGLPIVLEYKAGFVMTNSFIAHIDDAYLNLAKSTNLDVKENKVLEELNLLKLYPNPSSNICNLEFYSDGKNTVNIELFNVNGRLIKVLKRELLSAGTFEININVSIYNKGVYLVKYTNGALFKTSKLLIN